MKLLDWKYVDFQITVKTSMTVDQLIQEIEDRVGRFGKCTLCKHEYREMNEMVDGKKTLQDYGIPGSDSKENAPKSTICYDIKPFEDISQEPTLLFWMD